MPGSVTPAPDLIRELEILLLAHHPIIILETDDDARASLIIQHVAAKAGIDYYNWRPHRGLHRRGAGISTGLAPVATQKPSDCLAYLTLENPIGAFDLLDLQPFVDSPSLIGQLKDLHRLFYQHPGALFFSGADTKLPAELEHRVTRVKLAPPSRREYLELVRSIAKDVMERTHVDIAMNTALTGQLVDSLAGLALFEVKKILTATLVERGRLDQDTIREVRDAKQEIVQRWGVLEYFATEETLESVAGLETLKGWLHKRKVAFLDPARAEQFGLEPPKGILLIGVQGCGKSLCAKAVAQEWSLPLLRLDPGRLYRSLLGETEANLRRAIATAEAMAPIVLWIDELEKAFADSSDQDGGTSKRVFATFLSWMQDKKAGIFVIATANDVSALPPELLRKGRFDEIFFVDLPDVAVRERILSIHLQRRHRDPAHFDVASLAEATDGFSGAELEQIVVSALYAAFNDNTELTDNHLTAEAGATQPLSAVAAEKIAALRSWARGRTVAAQ